MAKYLVQKLDNGTPIGVDEPVFCLRPQDGIALGAIDAYVTACHVAGLPQDFIDQVWEHRERFRLWQEENPDRVKMPD